MSGPRATYRVQLNRNFDLDAAADLVDYLAALGISHLYTSPVLQAVPGSTHGYDIVDHGRVSDELGGTFAFARLGERLAASGLGQVLDIVPNHMAIDRENLWWWDVLENGPSSPFAACFDVEWESPEPRWRNLMVVPILADHYGRLLEKGEIRVVRDAEGFHVVYGEHILPVSPRTVRALLAPAAASSESTELAFLADAFGVLPLSTATDRPSVTRRHRDKEILRRLLVRLLDREPDLAVAVDATLDRLNADADALDEFLDGQNWRLTYWRVADREISYRRFFDIHTLVGLRVEDERVFAETHALPLAWVAAGRIDGLRIDHVDGLRSPTGYLCRLRSCAPSAWIVVEKVLRRGERLPGEWPVAGTTGYDFLNLVGGLLIDPAGEEPLSALYTEFTGMHEDYETIVRQKKELVLQHGLARDLNRLTALWLAVCERYRHHRDHTRHELHEALRTAIMELRVYRTYVDGEGPARDEDVREIVATLARARERRADIDSSLFEFLEQLWSGQLRGELEVELVMRLQQLTGPAMAKGAEDTACYVFNRLLSLNDVGGDPGTFAIEIDEFHRACLDTQAHWPETMLATSTHDTKRSEDVRARVSLLSEIPARWGEAVGRWSRANADYWRGADPDRNAEYLLYQTLVGAWPIEPERVLAYMEKAAREAKTHTSWTDPDPEYESRLTEFVSSVLADRAFVANLERFVAPLIEPGRINSLAQTLIKLTAPGIPDIYQGTELWDGSLVDPDNRRPVDFARRRRLLAELNHLQPAAIWARLDDGLPKLWVIRQALHLRDAKPHLFGRDGSYRPIRARGAGARHVVAFARREGAVTIVPRLPITLGGSWDDTELDLGSGRWHDVLSGETHGGGVARLGRLLETFPLALLVNEAA